MAERRFYWLKLKNTYFNQISQKKMKRQEHGTEMQVIYLRMMLLSINSEGCIYYQGVYDTLAEELAEEFDEPVELIEKTLNYLIDNHMITTDDVDGYYLPEAVDCIGSEAASTQRSRECRARKKASAEADQEQLEELQA